jgi:hypothetical protein
MVYYDIRREMYFYPEKGNWFIIETLPKNLDARLGDYVIIEMDTDKPYLYSKRHIKQFPRKDSKKVRTTCGRKLFLCWFMSMQLDDRGLQY